MFFEIKKYNPRLILLIIGTASGLPFLTTLFVMTTQQEAMRSLPLALITENLVGPWSAILFGILTIVLTHITVEVERESSLLYLYKAYKASWFPWILRKLVFVAGVLLTIVALNSTLNTLLFYQILSARDDLDQLPTVLMGYNYDIFLSLVFVLPALVFQLYLSLVFRKVILASAMGMLLLIAGIPVANLTDIYLIPYSFSIFIRKASVNTFTLSTISTIVVGVGVFATNLLLKRFRR